MGFDFLNPDSYKNAYEDVKDSLPNIDVKKGLENAVGGEKNFLGDVKNGIGQFSDDVLAKLPWVWALKEAWNEMTGFNKNREKEYNKKVAGDARAAQELLDQQELARNGQLDAIASQTAARGRMRSSRGRTSLQYANDLGTSDLLGV